MTLHAPQLDLPIGAQAPSSWDDGQGVSLPLDHVISRDRHGNTVSHVRDFQWDFTCYHPRMVSTKLVFWYWRNTKRTIQDNEVTPERIARIRELQYLMFLRVYRSERPCGVRQLEITIGLLRHLAAYAEERSCTVRDVLERSDVLDDYIAKLPSAKNHLLITCIGFLRTLDPIQELGFEIAQPKMWGALFDRAKEYRDGHGQHAPLPTRVYIQLIQGLTTEIDMLEAHMDRIQAAMREATELYGVYKAKGWKMGPKFGPEVLAKYGLEALLTRYGCDVGLKGLAALLTHGQRIAKLQIHVFSGMRDEEAAHLPYHCMDIARAGHGHKHAWISGVTTKLAGGRNRRAGWVTTEEQGFRAIRLAQKIADPIYEVLGVLPSATETSKDAYPLFISTGHLPWVNYPKQRFEGLAASRKLQLQCLPEAVKDKLCAVIEAGDVEELEAIDPFRDWPAEQEFEVGTRWSLKSHQLRRSLALYANASGLVKSSSLRRQLQHITSEMAQYYGRGSVFAKNFLADDPEGFKDHIALEWQDSEQEAQYLAFTRDVLKSEEPLWGPAGVFYDLQKKRGEVMSELDVKEQLKAGRMAYKAHPLGGCTHIGTCSKQKGLRLTSGICVSEACKSLIGKHSQIIRLIPIQRAIVAQLDPESIAFAMEKEELDILETTEKEWNNTKRLALRKGAAHE